MNQEIPEAPRRKVEMERRERKGEKGPRWGDEMRKTWKDERLLSVQEEARKKRDGEGGRDTRRLIKKKRNRKRARKTGGDDGGKNARQKEKMQREMNGDIKPRKYKR